ncbi:MAG: 50S ribosomal protein L4 [Fidelibacterota bacterium]
MRLNVIKTDGGKAATVTVDKSVFGIEPNEAAVRDAVLAELANSRQGTHASRNRALVRGGGRKPWRQKGRGVARAGTTRSPIWRGGGTVFGPRPHSHSFKLPKKVKQLARRSVLSQRVKEKNILVVDSLKVTAPRTKEFVKLLQSLDLDQKKITVLVAKIENDLYLAARNIPNVFVVQADHASTYELLDSEVLLVDKKGLKILNDQLVVKS